MELTLKLTVDEINAVKELKAMNETLATRVAQLEASAEQ
jgi:hypothetical protein